MKNSANQVNDAFTPNDESVIIPEWGTTVFQSNDTSPKDDVPDWIDTPSFEDCPARCKRSDKCFGTAYFAGKPGKAEHCSEQQCPGN